MGILILFERESLIKKIRAEKTMNKNNSYRPETNIEKTLYKDQLKIQLQYRNS